MNAKALRTLVCRGGKPPAVVPLSAVFVDRKYSLRVAFPTVWLPSVSKHVRRTGNMPWFCCVVPSACRGAQRRTSAIQ